MRRDVFKLSHVMNKGTSLIWKNLTRIIRVENEIENDHVQSIDKIKA